MDTTPSSSCALRRRLLGLFNAYSTVVSNRDSAGELAEVRRLEACRYHSCLNDLAHLSSFRNLFVGNEDDRAIRVAAAQLRSRWTQNVLWREAVRRDSNYARQKLRLNPLEVKRTVVPCLSNDNRTGEDLLGEAFYSPSTCRHGMDSASSKDARVGDDARNSISWDALYSVVVLYLYDHHFFHNSFLDTEVHALRSSNEGGKRMHIDPNKVCVKGKHIKRTAMTPPRRRKATYANSATGVAAVQAAKRKPCVATASAASLPWSANLLPSLQNAQLRKPNMEIAVDAHVGGEDAGGPLESLCAPPCPLRRGLWRTSPATPSLYSPVSLRHATCAALSPRCALGCGEDPVKPSPSPRRQHTQHEVAEPSYQQRYINFMAKVEVFRAGERFFHRASSVSESSLLSWSPPSGMIAVVPKRMAAATRQQWSTSPSPRRPERVVVAFGNKHAAASPTPQKVRALRLRPQTPSQQNVMVGQLREHHFGKHRTRNAGAAAPTLVTIKRNARAKRPHTSLQPQAANSAGATPRLATREGGTRAVVNKQTMCLLVPQPLAPRSVLAKAQKDRRKYSRDLKAPPATGHEECFCQSEESASLLDIKLQCERATKRSDSSEHVEGRRTTAFAVGPLRWESTEESSGGGLMQPDWVRRSSPAKPSPPVTPCALLRAPVLPPCTLSAAPLEVQDAANDQENQPPPTQTSRRRSSFYLEKPSHLSFGDPFALCSVKAERHATAPSPTPTPREDETDTQKPSEVHCHASAAAAPLPLHLFTAQQEPRQRPRQPQQQSEPIQQLTPQQLIGRPRLLFTPRCTSPLASKSGSNVSSTEQQQKHRKCVPVSANTNSAAPTLSPFPCEAAHRLLMSTPTRPWSPGPSSLTCRTPTSVLSPMNRQLPAPLSPALTKGQQHQADGRSPPPRLSGRAKARFISCGSRPPQTPPQVPSSRVLMSPSGSLQVATPPSVSPLVYS
ncbi:hypothetical protein, conserved [Leishmania tarentolae]|uniref:Uncharacterized protein n=1 Tax=Leishmania tarentolae TaxID=5689 RepID=A0A640KRH3_LEITA|nr:hypothetical protein, conserved [Leishmania tarentolae]